MLMHVQNARFLLHSLKMAKVWTRIYVWTYVTAGCSCCHL